MSLSNIDVMERTSKLNRSSTQKEDLGLEEMKVLFDSDKSFESIYSKEEDDDDSGTLFYQYENQFQQKEVQVLHRPHTQRTLSNIQHDNCSPLQSQMKISLGRITLQPDENGQD